MWGYPLHISWQQKLNMATFLLIVGKGQVQPPQQGGIIKERHPPPTSPLCWEAPLLFHQLIRVSKTIRMGQGFLHILFSSEAAEHLGQSSRMDRTWARKTSKARHLDLRNPWCWDILAQPQQTAASLPAVCAPGPQKCLGDPLAPSSTCAGP